MRVFVAATIATTLLLLPQSGFAVGAGDLSGTWKLDRERSDDPAQKLREGGGPSRRGGGFRGRRGGGGFGGRHGRPTDEGEENGGSDFFQDSRAFDLLTIVHRDPELRITDGVGLEHVLYTDGRKIDEERSSGSTKVRAKWKDGRIVVATTPEHGPKITETYAVTADGSSLTVTTRVEGRGRELEFRRVYDAMR